jgi:hypothetical protein
MKRALSLLLICLSALSVAQADYVIPQRQSYSVDFSDTGLPPGAVVTSLTLEVETSGEVYIRKLPPGWMAGTESAGPKKIVVSISRSNWVEEKGRDLPLASLSGYLWIREVDADDRPVLPVVKVSVEVAPVAGEKLYKRVDLSPPAFHLTYVP